jgi:hypothetical protein
MAGDGEGVSMRIQTFALLALFAAAAAAEETPRGEQAARLRVIIETDAGGDPDDEQSLVRFLLYTNEWDVEGIIANRPKARDGENRNIERTGLGIVRRLVKAYGECHANLVLHDHRYPPVEQLLEKTVPGYDDRDEGVQLLVAAVDRADPRPIWFLNWGTDSGGATSCLKRALDRVLQERGPPGYAAFKKKLRVICHGNIAGEHTTKHEPPFPLLVDTFRPALEGQRWYHRFSGLTATAGGFDLQRDVLTGHGPLGALYPTNTTHPQKEGDTPTFLYLLPAGLSDPEQPTWGSWAGRYGLNPEFQGRPCYWANQADTWKDSTHRDNTVRRWAADLQNDFRARLDWCVKPFREANHAPSAVVNGDAGRRTVHVKAAPGAIVSLDAKGSTDPDSQELTYEWTVYGEAGTYAGHVHLEKANTPQAGLHVPRDAGGKTIHVFLTVRDAGSPPLASYRRVIVEAARP